MVDEGVFLKTTIKKYLSCDIIKYSQVAQVVSV